MRRLSIQIKRGTELYPIPKHIFNKDGSIAEYVYFKTAKICKNEPWVLTLRDFANFQKTIYKLPDVSIEKTLFPAWCSWTDWFSDDVTDEVILKNVVEGLSLGIKNFIIDDGWFGPGLDSDYGVELNIGDWEPDPAKIKDMHKLVKSIKNLGGVPIIWCAPHAVAKCSICFKDRKRYLVKDKNNELLMTPNKFHSLCFMNPIAREIISDICANFIKKWDFDGAKYDLFNCVQNIKCCNSEHTHDVFSMMRGLELTLELINKKCRALKKDFIVELKQNYATPFLAKYGTMVRAGDTPYNPEGNFVRTLYNQAYTPFSMNDYQTITNEDSSEDTACIIIKMISVGIPSYSIDFDRLNNDNKNVIKFYNTWYGENIKRFTNFRIPLDGENNAFKLPGKESDLYFLVNSGLNFKIEKSSTIFNGTHNTDIFLNTDSEKTADVSILDCFGKEKDKKSVGFKGWTHISMLPGGMIKIIF